MVDTMTWKNPLQPSSTENRANSNISKYSLLFALEVRGQYVSKVNGVKRNSEKQTSHELKWIITARTLIHATSDIVLQLLDCMASEFHPRACVCVCVCESSIFGQLNVEHRFGGKSCNVWHEAEQIHVKTTNSESECTASGFQNLFQPALHALHKRHVVTDVSSI